MKNIKTRRRFYILPDHVKNETAHISGREAHHIRVVLRMVAGDQVVLFDGIGNEYNARIRSIQPNRVYFDIIGTLQSTAEPRCRVTIAQALLKKKKMDGLIRQLTEIGIARFVPFVSRRSVPKPAASKMVTKRNRWETIAIEAVKQCRRGRPPKVGPLVSFDDLVNAIDHPNVRIILWENATKPLADCLNEKTLDGISEVLLTLGPEGGFSKSEIESAEENGFLIASLGPRILRAETAALTASVIAMHQLGELS